MHVYKQNVMDYSKYVTKESNRFSQTWNIMFYIYKSYDVINIKDKIIAKFEKKYNQNKNTLHNFVITKL